MIFFILLKISDLNLYVIKRHLFMDSFMGMGVVENMILNMEINIHGL